MTTQNQPREVSFAPTLDTSIYASGDQMGSLMTISNFTDQSSGAVMLRSLVVVDKDKQKAAFDLLLFNALPTVASSDNAALDISDSEMASKFIGKISVAAADYTDLANSSYACIKAVDTVIQLSGSTTLYAICRCGASTPTYAASSLQLKLGYQS